MRRPNIFYGWFIVGASFFIALYMGGAVFYGFTAFIEPIADEMGWNYTQISLAASLRGLELGILAPIIGILVDRWGPRRLIGCGVIIAFVGLILLSAATSLLMFYGAFALIAIGMSASSLTVLMTAIANWFRVKIGIAFGIAISGYGFSGLFVPVITRLIAEYDWRTTVIILALSMLCVVLPLSFLFRHKPEQYGHFPDGQAEDLTAYGNDSGLLQAVESDVRARQILKKGIFWQLALPFAYHTLAVSTVVTHVMPYLSSVGVNRASSSFVATAIPLMSIVGRLGWGWLGDRFDRRLVAVGSFALMGFGLLCFGYASATSAWLFVPFLVLFGIGYGGGNALRPSMVREYFGRASFGTVLGLIIGIGGSGVLLGPTVAGWAYDNWGSYQTIWFLLAGIATVVIGTILTIPTTQSTIHPGDEA